MKIEEKVRKMGYEFFDPPKGKIEPAVFSEDVIYVSGCGPISSNGKILYSGKVDKEISIEDSKKAAKIAAFNCINAIHFVIGDLSRIERILKVTGFVNSDENFAKQHEVVNGASDFLIQLFGEKGKHARTAIGVRGLPNNICVEIQMVAKIKD
jgi:enamine deaminase RidA (YjgF/YER057c/UK114 family)